MRLENPFFSFEGKKSTRDPSSSHGLLILVMIFYQEIGPVFITTLCLYLEATYLASIDIIRL